MIRTAIRRPMAVAMTFIAIAATGIVSFIKIPLELLPDVEYPRLTIRAPWPGASPEVVEAFLTAPLEAAAQQVKGVGRVRSESSEGISEL